jgi:hypothetical protein
MQYLDIRSRLEGVVLSSNVTDTLHWRWCASGLYSSSSAYSALFLGSASISGARELWKVKAPNEFKLFVCLVALDRCWTSERLQRHGLRNRGPCALCDQEIESIDHLLLVQCAYSRELWFLIFRRCGWLRFVPAGADHFIAWWQRSRKLVPKARRPAFDSLTFLWRGVSGCNAASECLGTPVCKPALWQTSSRQTFGLGPVS